MMSSTLHIRLLGGFGLTYGDRPIIDIHSPRSQALLSYLLIHRDAPQSRQRLAFQLWTDSTDTQARTNLRKELSYLRRDLPDAEQFLRIESKTLQWLPTAPFTLDAMAFETAVKAAETDDSDTQQAYLEQAIALYRGELLPGCEDEWILAERDRLQHLYVRALEQLIECLKAQQDYRLALNYAQQLLRMDTLNESAYCILMRLYHLNGDRANALQVYHRCMAILCEELGVDPSPTTRKLYEQLLREEDLADETSAHQAIPPSAGPVPRPSLAPVLPTLVGRQQEWESIQSWANLTHPNATQVLLLTGEPGIGKTRLLEELRGTVNMTLWGRGFAPEMVRPYGIWIDALRSVTLPTAIPAELAFLLPEVGQSIKAPPDRSHLFDAVVKLLAEWAAQATVVVILDDIQWIDEASSALLHYASRLLSHLPVKFACTARSGELSRNASIWPVFQALRREQRLTAMELQPFDRGTTSELIRSVHPAHAFDVSLELADRVFADSGGNPLFVLEIVRALSQHLSRHSYGEPPSHTDNLSALIRDRLQQLDDAARDLLPWATALGRSFNPMILEQVADYPVPQLLTAIAQLEQQSMIRPSNTVGNEMGYDFVHDIVRQVVYQEISEPRRRLVHLQIAHKLHQTATPDHALAGDIAHHAALGGDYSLAASSALQAAERCLKLFAYAEAAVLAERGVQFCQALDRQMRIRIQLGLLRVWALAGVTGDRATQIETGVHQLLEEANQLGLKEEEAIGLEALGSLYFEQSDYTNIHRYSQRTVDVSRAASPATAARLLGFSGSCLVEMGREMMRGEALLLEAQSLANRVGLEFCDIHAGLGSVELHKAHYEAAQTFLQRALQLAQMEQDRWRECNCLTYLIMTELEAGDAIAALSYGEIMTRMVAQIEGKESESAVAFALTTLSHYQLQHANAEVDLEAAIVRLTQLDIKRMLAYILIGAAEADLEQKRYKLAAMRAEAALESAQIMNHPSHRDLAGAVLIQSLLALGEQEQAIAQFATVQQQIDRPNLSVRAQIQIERVTEQIQSLTDQFRQSSHPS
ncbi:MAG: BTAD domain-containing putative transcriptional regulator [Thermosynechococcaceae cyanobacterium]